MRGLEATGGVLWSIVDSVSASTLVAPLATPWNPRAVSALSEAVSSASEANDPRIVSMAVLALILSAIAVVGIYLFTRRSLSRKICALEAELAASNMRFDRLAHILDSEPQIVLSWAHADAPPAVDGDGMLLALAGGPARVLEFGSWLHAEDADILAMRCETLLRRGEPFSAAIMALEGRHLEAIGKPISGNAVLRIRDLAGDRLELEKLSDRFEQVERELAAHRAALDAAKMPAWLRDSQGRLKWCNASYTAAVEAPSAAIAVEAGHELFDLPVRRDALSTLREGRIWHREATAVVGGQRRAFHAAEAPTKIGSAGIARDISETAALRAELERNEADTSRMMDRLSTAVAIFDKSKRLTFYNAAYRQMWALESVFLDQRPTDSEVLDRLRANRLLPEQADFRAWKTQQLAAYQTPDASETVWHLPDGRALRVVTIPNPKGGLTYLYDDATQSYALASRVNALTHVQGETLDALKEGVAVFGADGRMNLFNPVFARMWRIEPEALRKRPHIDDIGPTCLNLCKDPSAWEDLWSMVVGLSERRESRSTRIERLDGITLDAAALPLPDGAMLLTFADITASTNMERALTERNEALVAADKLRNDFVNHVSYELRTPLTNIIGFTQLLAAGGVGELNSRQLEYAGFITNSSHALLAIIDDILDLASIDAGALELDLEDVDVADAMRAAAAGVQDRLEDAAIEMRIVLTDGVGSFRADGRRVRQVLFNLLSNAINYSESGQTVTMAAMRRGHEIVFKVADRGRGIPPDMIDRVFNRFETFPNGSRHRGPGLGLAIVRALVELHNGRVFIDTAPNEGTTVTCIFPRDPAVSAEAEDAPMTIRSMAR